MKTTSLFDFSVDKANRTISIKREFAAELPLLWTAYTTPEILDQWWAPKPWKAKTKTMEFRNGGRWLYAMLGPDGEEHWSVVNYSDIQSQKSFAGIDAFSDSEGNINRDLPTSKWEVKFSDMGDVTLVEINLSFDEVNQLETIMQMGFKEGLSAAMDGLDQLLPQLK